MRGITSIESCLKSSIFIIWYETICDGAWRLSGGRVFHRQGATGEKAVQSIATYWISSLVEHRVGLQLRSTVHGKDGFEGGLVILASAIYVHYLLWFWGEIGVYPLPCNLWRTSQNSDSCLSDQRYWKEMVCLCQCRTEGQTRASFPMVAQLSHPPLQHRIAQSPSIQAVASQIWWGSLPEVYGAMLVFGS